MHGASFRRLALCHVDLLFAVAVRATGSRERAEDLVQETYRIAFERWHTLRDPGACRGWLLRILRNAHVDEIRRTRRLVLVDQDAFDLADGGEEVDRVAAISARLTVERLERVLSGLPEQSRWLFWLREIEGLAYAELAEVFGVPVGTIRSRLARLRSQLVSLLDSSREGRQGGRRREDADG